MTYKQARAFIDQSNQYGCVPGLETIMELLNRLGNPQEQLKIIHVAGTNGKGSTSAFLTSILCAADYRVGRYISPAVYSYREIIQISERDIKSKKENCGSENYSYLNNNHVNTNNNEDNKGCNPNMEENVECCSIGIEYITEQGICETIARIKPICETMLTEGYSHPTSFEIETAMAMLYLLWENVDFAIIEVGLGGRLDATNVMIHPVCSIITSISMDHMQYLGDTLEQIATEKAGIIKMQSPVVTCRQEPQVMKVLEETCEERKTKLTISDWDAVENLQFSPEATTFTLRTEHGEEDYRIRMLGGYQVENAALAIQAAKIINQLGYSLSNQAIQHGLYLTKWNGRFEMIARRPYLMVDGAHNEAAAMVLRNSIQLYFTNNRIIFMIGVLADKDYKSILRVTAPLADVIITFTPNNNRALSSSVLAKEAKQYDKRIFDAVNLESAVELAYQEAGAEDVIVAFGSLSFLGDLVSTLGIRKDEETYDR